MDYFLHACNIAGRVSERKGPKGAEYGGGGDGKSDDKQRNMGTRPRYIYQNGIPGLVTTILLCTPFSFIHCSSA